MFNKPFGFGRQCGCEKMCCEKPCMEREITEPAITNCIEREFYHEVPHVQPIHTHIINKHIYKHTCTPCYTCSEENQVINMDCCCKQNRC